MYSVAVIGGAGYVGGQLCEQLARDGAQVTGVVRPGSGFLLDHRGVDWATPDDAGLRGPFDIVVNLAYPTRGSVYEYPAQNQALLNQIRQLATPEGRVLQVSTQAVFGMALEYPQVSGPLPMRGDLLYVESKLELERLLVEELVGPELHIVRLGNVWGPGSATWTATLAQRLLFGEPVAVHHQDGFSNVTDVANLVSYLSFLVQRTPCGDKVSFHHLAELGHVRWSSWIDRMSDRLGVSPLSARAPAYSMSRKAELRAALVTHPPRAIARELKEARFTGSVVRSLMRRLPERASRALRSEWAEGGLSSSSAPGEDLFLTVVACDTLFEPFLDSAWTPPLDADASWLAVAAWLDEVGYT